MSYFDPKGIKRSYKRSALALERSYELWDPGSFPKGAVSASILSTCIVAALVSFSSETQDIAERTQRWLQEAIDEGEFTTDRPSHSADWHQQSLSYSLALIKFLRGQGIDQASFARSGNLTERSWRARPDPINPARMGRRCWSTTCRWPTAVACTATPSATSRNTIQGKCLTFEPCVRNAESPIC